jgi:hypothetical protein
MSRRKKSILVSAAVALSAWWAFPAAGIDRTLFYLTTKPIAISEDFISGRGTKNQPFTFHSFRGFIRVLSKSAPLDIAFSDESATYFESSPPSATDMAGILKSLRQLGRESVAIGMPMVWDDPSVLYLTALDQQLDSFSRVITSAPLSRRPETSPIPSAFRRASIPLSGIKGNSQLLPIVNYVPIPDVVLGNTNSLAGFTTLESEGATDHPYLLARWDDRVVLSFHLLAALDHFHVAPSEISVQLGKCITLGSDGPLIAIDEFGRLRVKPPLYYSSLYPPVPAENLILAPDDFLAESHSRSTLIRSSISSTDPTAAAYSESLVASIAILSYPEGTIYSRRFPRLPWYADLLLIASVLSLLYGFGNYPFLSGKLPLIILAGILFILHFVLVDATSTWLPTFPLLACTLAAIPFAAAIRPPEPEAPPVAKPIPTEVRTEIAPAEEVAKEAPREPLAEITDPVKMPAKKAARKAAQKATAKKAPRKRKRS